MQPFTNEEVKNQVIKGRSAMAQGKPDAGALFIKLGNMMRANGWTMDDVEALFTD